jgi:thymidylate synthase
MVKVIECDSVDEGLVQGIEYLNDNGVAESSRYGDVIVAPGPVVTVFRNPTARVSQLEWRDANPFFHLFEACWMLAGRNDVAPLVKYAKRMAEFSDDGQYFHGAYGHRWRKHFLYDQLMVIVFALKANPNDRRQVLTMWDATVDPQKAANGGKDVPCNTQAYFLIRDGKLTMTVTNRSNDIIWGLYGANAVHFSILQEYMATLIGVPVGEYVHVSNNYHYYTANPAIKNYDARQVVPGTEPSYPMAMFDDTASRSEIFHRDLNNLLQFDTRSFHHPWFQYVVGPMLEAHDWYKTGSFDSAYRSLDRCGSRDWQQAGIKWLMRRENRARTNAQGANPS